MKRAISALVLLALVAMLAVPGFCEMTAVRVGALTGPTAMGMAQLLDEPEYTPTIVGAADELMPRILQGEVDIAAVPANERNAVYLAVHDRSFATQIQPGLFQGVGKFFLWRHGRFRHRGFFRHPCCQ